MQLFGARVPLDALIALAIAVLSALLVIIILPGRMRRYHRLIRKSTEFAEEMLGKYKEPQAGPGSCRIVLDPSVNFAPQPGGDGRTAAAAFIREVSAAGEPEGAGPLADVRLTVFPQEGGEQTVIARLPALAADGATVAPGRQALVSFRGPGFSDLRIDRILPVPPS